MTTVYSTKTPIISSNKYHFNYTCKRDAYVDCCYAILVLNKAAKTASPDMRFFLYRLKHRWIEKLYREGYCVQAYEDQGIWCLKFKVGDATRAGIVFAWHLPDAALTFHVEEKRGCIPYTYVKDLPLRTRPLEESIALLEWVLS